MAADAKARIKEGQSHTAMARLLNADGTAMTQAVIAAAVLYVYDRDSGTPTAATDTIPLAVADTVFDTLQTDARWPHGLPGYNFRHRVGSGVFTKGASTYLLEYSFTIFDPSSGTGAASENLTVTWEIPVGPVVHQ